MGARPYSIGPPRHGRGGGVRRRLPGLASGCIGHRLQPPCRRRLDSLVALSRLGNSKEISMATLAGQRAKFTLALNQYNLSEDSDTRATFARRMAEVIAAAPANGFTVSQVTTGQSYPSE